MRKIRGILSLLISAMTVLGLCAPLTALGAEVNGPVPTADVDQTDEAQFGQTNYQLNEFDGGYLKKTFRWTDKENGLGQVILEMELDEAPKGTVVYAFTPCIGHGFTWDKAKANIEWLLAHYDRVDLIYFTGYKNSDGSYVHLPSDLHLLEDAGTDHDNNNQADYLDVLESQRPLFTEGARGAHWSVSIYTALYQYLMGLDMGTITSADYDGSGDTQKRFPIAIYTAFDEFGEQNWRWPNGLFYKRDGIVTYHEVEYLRPDESYLMEYLNYDCWSIIYQYDQEGRYFSSGLDESGRFNHFSYRDNPAVTPDKYYPFNIIVALADPSWFRTVESATMENIPTDKFWDGSHIGDHVGNLIQNFSADYSYGETFVAQDALTVIPVTLVDTISDTFVIAPTDPLKKNKLCDTLFSGWISTVINPQIYTLVSARQK